MNKDKKTKLAFGLPDIKALCNKIIESFDKEDKVNKYYCLKYSSNL
jgi:hypothetical protein